jgi:hypothetical protein
MDYSGYTTLRVALHAGVARITLDNGPINLLDKPMFKELLRLVPQLAADDAVRVVVLASANPEFFIAHFDVGLILKFPADAPAEAPAADAPLPPFHQLCEALRTMPKATIAVVEGRAGGQLRHQAQQLLEHRLVQQVDGAVVQGDAGHARVQRHAQGGVAAVVHCRLLA